MGGERRLEDPRSTLVVGQNKKAQGRATNALVRPAEVATLAASLAPWVREGVPEGDLVASWLPQMRYLPDPRTRDIWQSPLATLARGGGDCEDLVILALSTLIAMGGGGVVLVGLLFQRTGTIGHAWLEGWDSAGWLHLEATSSVLTRFGRPPGYVPFAAYTPSAAGSRPRPKSG